MSKKKKRWIIALCIIAGIVILVPVLFFVFVFGSLWAYNAGTPDHSNDPLIPSGYVETDGEQGYGAGDIIEYNYYTYDTAPLLDDKFFTLTQGDTKLTELLNHLGEVEKWGELDGRISPGDSYYIDHISGDRNGKWGALMYFYDHETKTLHRIDFYW